MASQQSLPTGQVTFLFTDIEGSTRLLESLGTGFDTVLERHHALMRAAVAGEGGTIVGTEGDAFFAVFETPDAAVRAAAAAQRALSSAKWPDGHPVRVRMGLHTGEGRLGGDNYVGLDVHRAARIAAAAHGGQVLVSSATARASDHVASDGLEFVALGEHRLKDLSRAEHLYQLRGADLAASFPPPRTLSAVPNNLPSQVTSFVGRAAEVAEVRSLFRDGARLVTLVGPGGTGKTRLALQAAAELIDRYRDGVTFVDLSPILDASLVEAAIAEPLGVIDAPDRPLGDRLLHLLQERELLLVLDNFEQVVDAAPVVSRILQGAPRVSTLVTSRSPLRISGEREVEVSPLSIPAHDADVPLATVAGSEAVALFVERAAAVRNGFELNDGNVASVVEICRRLDGIPLAIELAAARVRLLPPSAILSRLERDTALLTGGARDLPERQRTLRATIAWSYELLEPPARLAFARFSAFAGGATFDASEQVCGPDEELGAPVIDAIANLVEQSLVRQTEQDGEPRLAMLGTIRAFAGEQLTATDAAPVRERHARWCLELAEEAAPELLGSNQRAWMDRLTLDHDNLRTAFDWAIESGEAESAARLGAALWRFWQMRGHLVEGRDRIARALNLPELAQHREAHARLLDAAGGIAYWLGDADGAASAYRRASELIDETSDPRLRVEVMTSVAMSLGSELPTAGSPEFQAFMLERRGMLEEALAIARAAGDTRAEATALWSIGTALEWFGDPEQSRQYLRESAEAAQRCDDLFHSTWATSMLASVALAARDLDEAGSKAREALRRFDLVGDLTGIMLNLAAIAQVLEERGDVAAAMRLHGASASFARHNGSRYLAMERGMRGQADPAEIAAADPVAGEAYRAGEEMTLEDAITFALDEAPAG